MKIKQTIKKIEEEIEDFERTFKRLEKEFPKARIIKGELFELKAKLSQHKTDIKNFEKLIDKENIYPTDIFPELDKQQLIDINITLKEVHGFPLDRLSAQVCRKILDNQKEALKEL